MKVYCLMVGHWDQDLIGIHISEESALKEAENYTHGDWWIDEWEVEDLINKDLH